SLFQLLSTARTHAGEATLAGWLASPGPAADVRERQAAVAELAPALDFREALALAGDDVRADVDVPRVAAWGRARAVPSRLLRAGVAIVAAGAVATWVAWMGGAIDARGPLLALVIEGGVAFGLHARVRRALHGIDVPARALGVLAAMLAVVERGEWSAPLLGGLKAALERQGEAPSAQIARLRRLIQLLDGAKNQFLAPVAWVLLWTTQTALAIGRWRADSGDAIAGWIAVLGEIEALASLGAHAFAHPDDAAPTIEDGGAVLSGRGLAHPALPPTR